MKLTIGLDLYLENRVHADTFRPAVLRADILASISEICREEINFWIYTWIVWYCIISTFMTGLYYVTCKRTPGARTAAPGRQQWPPDLLGRPVQSLWWSCWCCEHSPLSHSAPPPGCTQHLQPNTPAHSSQDHKIRSERHQNVSDEKGELHDT